MPPNERKNHGLQAVFNEVFPIESYDGKCILDSSTTTLGVAEVRPDRVPAPRADLRAPLNVTFRLIQNEDECAKRRSTWARSR